MAKKNFRRWKIVILSLLNLTQNRSESILEDVSDFDECGRSSVVECLLAKEKVVSSSLIARSVVGRPIGRLFCRDSSVGRAQH